jgi:ankyrin repeat protein
MQKLIFPGFLLTILFSFSSQAQSTSLTDSIRNAALFPVIRTGNSSQLEKMLTDGASSNAVSEGYSALMAAALNGTAEEMKILMKHGADINYRNEDSVTALWLAIPDYNKCELLLNAGVNPQTPGKGGYMPIVKLATSPGMADLMNLFVSKGAILKKSAPDNYLMYNAALTNDTAMLGICIRAGLHVNDTTYFGDYPIFNALGNRSFKTFKMLVDNGADVNVQSITSLTRNTATPLMFAALSNDHQAFFYLLDHGADPNQKSVIGMTTLMYAMQAQEDDPEITKYLLDHGANPSDKLKDGTDALYYASKMGDTESVRLIKSQLKP